MSDPTKASLELFNDLSRWVVVPNVPIFIPHERKRKGKVLYTIDNNALHTIGDEMIKLEAESGVLPKIQIGHTNESGDELTQPKIVGYAKDLKFGVWGPANKPGLLANLYYRKEDFHLAKDFPFRSPEYYPGRETITAVALLRQDPELDMGMLIFSRLDEREDYHHLEEKQKHEVVKMPSPEGEKFEQKPGVADTEKHNEIDSTPDARETMHKEMLEHYQRHFHEHYMRHGGLPHPQHHAEHYATAASADFHPLHETTAMNEAPTHPDAVKHNAGAGPGVASATDVLVPGGHKPEEVQRMQREEEAIKYRRQEERIAALEAQVKSEQYARQLAYCEQQVTQLQGEGYVIKSRPVLVEKLAKLGKDECEERLKEIRENYARAPIERPFIPLHREENGTSNGTSREQSEAAVSLASREKIDFNTALGRIKGGK